MVRRLSHRQSRRVRLRRHGVRRSPGSEGHCEASHHQHSGFIASVAASNILTQVWHFRYAKFPQKNCGAGFFLNSAYEIEHSILIEKDVKLLNQHEFNIEASGNRTLIITHDTEKLNASDIGLDDGIWTRTDGFREIHTQTGETVFDWRIQDHVSINESSYFGRRHTTYPHPEDYSQLKGWDGL